MEIYQKSCDREIKGHEFFMDEAKILIELQWI